MTRIHSRKKSRRRVSRRRVSRKKCALSRLTRHKSRKRRMSYRIELSEINPPLTDIQISDLETAGFQNTHENKKYGRNWKLPSSLKDRRYPKWSSRWSEHPSYKSDTYRLPTSGELETIPEENRLLTLISTKNPRTRYVDSNVGLFREADEDPREYLRNLKRVQEEREQSVRIRQSNATLKREQKEAIEAFQRREEDIEAFLRTGHGPGPNFYSGWTHMLM